MTVRKVTSVDIVIGGPDSAESVDMSYLRKPPSEWTEAERADYREWRARQHAERIANGWYDTDEDPPGW